MDADSVGCGDAPPNCSMTRIEIKKPNIRHNDNVQQQEKLHYTKEVTIQTSAPCKKRMSF